MHNLTNNSCLSSYRYGAEVRQSEIPADATEAKFAGLRHPQQNRSGKNINQCSGASPVQISKSIAQRRRDREREGDLGRRATRCGFEAQVAIVDVDVPGLQSNDISVLFLRKEVFRVCIRTTSPAPLPIRLVHS